MHPKLAVLYWLLLALAPATLIADEPSIFSHTLGGKQFWADVAIFHDWHIQEHILTGHCRLLDGENVRRTWGSFEHCQATLNHIKRSESLPPMSGKAVIMVHGLLSTSSMFELMKEDVRQAGYMPVTVAYPSGYVDIKQASAYLQRCMQSLEGVEEIYIVAHSLGGLVVRACLAEHEDRRVQRIVMIGVPNNGAHLADFGEGNWLWEKLGPPAAQQLVTDPQGFIAKLPQPPCSFAVIAGGKGDDSGFSLLIPGDDDEMVAVASTQLTNSADFSVVRCEHRQLPKHEEVRKQALSFIKTGRLRE